MANYNKVMLMGNLTRDPELRHTPQGTAVGQFGLAVNRKRGDKEETTFVEIVVWAKQADVCAEYLTKGRLVFIEGRLQQNRWETDEGGKRSQIVVVAEKVQFLPSGNGNGKGKPSGEIIDGAPANNEEEVPF